MIYSVRRYNVQKAFIASGELTVQEENSTTTLTYRDAGISVSTTNTNDVFSALVCLRKKMENEYGSILAINGCRIDTTYMSTSSHGTYVIKNGQPSSRVISIFDATTEIHKLCTTKEHEAAYEKWLESILTL